MLVNKSVRKANENVNANTHLKSQYTCVNHPQKLASHQLIGSQCNDMLFYCEKCSIMFASQGFNVQRINLKKSNSLSMTTPQQQSRKRQIDGFMIQLDDHLQLLYQKDSQIYDFLLKSQNQYGSLIENINSFYNQIEEIIQLQKFISYNTILNKRAARQADARLLRQSLRQYIQDTVSIIQDIKNNIDTVENVQYTFYQTIMNGYKQRVNNSSQILNQQIKSFPKLQIVLPQIPKMLYSLADKITFGTKSRKSSVQTSMITPLHMKPQQIVTQQYSVQSQSASNQKQSQILQQSNLVKESGRQLAFSFESNKNISKESGFHLNMNEIGNNSNFLLIKSDRYEEMSKIEQKVNGNQIVESRESLGAYLNIEESRDRYEEQNQTDTLLIA